MRWPCGLWLLSGAGMLEAPGRLNPIASTLTVMVDAVPIVMHVPQDRAMPFSISCQSSWVIFPARNSSQYFQVSLPDPSLLPFQLPLSIGPAGMKIAGRLAEMAPISIAGVVLSQPPISTMPSSGWARAISSTSIASRLR